MRRFHTREAERAAIAAAEAEAAEEAAAEEAAALEEAEAGEAAQQAELDSRDQLVPEIEESVREMAEGHVDDEFVEGPILEVRCSPVGGGSMEDLSQQTTVFECFVANEDHDDGTHSGYYYNATMNWSTGSFTCIFGQP